MWDPRARNRGASSNVTLKTLSTGRLPAQKPRSRTERIRGMRNPSSAAPRSAGRKRGPTPCCSKVGLKRGPWTPEEDEILVTTVQREGEGRWRTLPKRAGLLRCGKSCRLRWMNYLRPSIKHGQIAPDEEDLILRLHRLLGNRWSLIAGRIPGRTDNEIKNYWNTHLSKKLISQGIDPRTHKPLNPDHKIKPPAAHVTAPVPYPNPNPNVFCALEEIHGCRRGIMLDDHQSNYPDGFDVPHSVPWESSEAFALMDLQRSHGGNGDEEDGGVDGCTDDVFTSFLDSLINEDMFLQPQQKQQKQDISNSGHNNDQNEAIDAAILPATTGFSYGDLWQAGLPSPATLGEEVHDQFAGHTSKQF